MKKEIGVVAARPVEFEESRRALMAAAGGAGIGMTRPVCAAPLRTPLVAGILLESRMDAPGQVVVSWHSLQPVGWPRVLVGTRAGTFHGTVDADTVRDTDVRSGQALYIHVASIRSLLPLTEYLCAAGHDGADAEFATFSTGPTGRVTFHGYADPAPAMMGPRHLFGLPSGFSAADTGMVRARQC